MAGDTFAGVPLPSLHLHVDAEARSGPHVPAVQVEALGRTGESSRSPRDRARGSRRSWDHTATGSCIGPPVRCETGSGVRDPFRRRDATSGSDVDLLVDALPGASLLDHARLKTELRKVLGRSVDVVEEEGIPWSIRPHVLAEAVTL